MKRLIAFGIFLNAALMGVRAWQKSVALAGPAPARNGDVNGDGTIDISDATYLLNWLFIEGPPPMQCASGGDGPIRLPQTGQTGCTGAWGDVVDCVSAPCTGQDGLHQTGCSIEGRFVDNGDGTVTDNCTGLMWQKDTGNDGHHTDWCSALNYCERLELAGYADWRLPNVRELQSIGDYGRFDPAIDPVFGALSSFYWSSTTVENDRRNAWIFSFHRGDVATNNKTSVGGEYVRAVRTAP